MARAKHGILPVNRLYESIDGSKADPRGWFA